MPHWYFFAFEPKSVAEVLLKPAQQAVRSCDLAAWQKVFDVLNRSHPCPEVHPSEFAAYYAPNQFTLVQAVAANRAVSADKIPEESDFGLRRTLQAFVESVSLYRERGRFPSPRHWILDEVDWHQILKSDEELSELEFFKTRVIARSSKLPDPYWCLESNDAVDSNYVTPEVVGRMAELEDVIGLFRQLARRTDLATELAALANDLASVGLLVQQAARSDLGMYFRQDGT